MTFNPFATDDQNEMTTFCQHLNEHKSRILIAFFKRYGLKILNIEFKEFTDFIRIKYCLITTNNHKKFLLHDYEGAFFKIPERFDILLSHTYNDNIWINKLKTNVAFNVGSKYDLKNDIEHIAVNDVAHDRRVTSYLKHMNVITENTFQPNQPKQSKQKSEKVTAEFLLKEFKRIENLMISQNQKMESNILTAINDIRDAVNDLRRRIG